MARMTANMDLAFIPPIFPFATFNYGVVMPARCHAYGVDSPVVCGALDFPAVEREAAIRVLRCESHAADAPLECHHLELFQLNVDARFHGHDPMSHPLHPRVA